MDDTKKLRAEFPLGDYTRVIAREPSEQQALMLALTRVPKGATTEDQKRMVQRLFSLVETLVGTDVWYDVVELAVLTEKVTEAELMQFCTDILTFDWKAHRSDGAAPEPAPVAPDEDRPRPAPRIVSGD